MREAYDGGLSTEDAVREGIKSSAGWSQARPGDGLGVRDLRLAHMLEFKQMGVGLATAILIDATIVRGVLLPATMKLLGDWNWYLPSSLGWLPRVAHEPARA